MMAKMLVHDAKHLSEQQEFIRLQEPCVDSEAMVIVLTQALREESRNRRPPLDPKEKPPILPSAGLQILRVICYKGLESLAPQRSLGNPDRR
jgi:hypothetical protein